MQHLGFRSLLVLTKIGHDLRDQFSDTLHEPVEEAFGSLLIALDDAEAVLTLSSSEYQWTGDDKSFRYARIGN